VSFHSRSPQTLLHLTLVDMSPAFHELVPRGPLGLHYFRVVAIIELLHDLESPSAMQDIAADQLGAQAFCPFDLPQLLQPIGGLAHPLVGSSDELMELVKVASRSLDALEGFGELPHRGYHAVADTLGTRVLRIDRLRHSVSLSSGRVVAASS